MSPTISELQDVLDWQAIVVMQAVDERGGATVDDITDATDLGRGVVESRLQQVTTLGLVAEAETDAGTVYELTGQGHGAAGAGLYDEYDLVGEADIDDLAEQVAGLLDRRDALRAEVGELRDDATEIREKATRQFGDREDVRAEFESLMADIESLATALDGDGSGTADD
jgi:NTP pyrophosphatase (non-canonical NTP hydrolase)